MPGPGVYAPLEGLTVADLSEGVSGPFCSMLLGDLGARVVKVEPLHGDWSRELEPRRDDESAIFLALNRNKESIALERGAAAGLEIIEALARQADIVICDELPDPEGRAELGYDYATLSRLNPQIIYGLVTPFGERGPWAHRAASELVVQAASGYPRYLGASGAEPVRVGADIAGTMGGVFLLQGLLAAWWHRVKVGVGQCVSVSQLGSLYALKTIQIAAQHDPDAWEGYHCWGPYDPPDTGWQTRDRPIVFSFGEFTGGGPGKVSQWPEFCRDLGLDDLLSDPRFDQDGKNSTGLGADAARLRSAYEAGFGQKSAAELVDLVRSLGGAAYPYHTHETLFADEQAGVLGLPGPGTDSDGRLAGVRAPWTFSGLRCEARGPAPALGESTGSVLVELGYDRHQRTRLFDAGVVAGTSATAAATTGRPHRAPATPAPAPRASGSLAGPLDGLRVLDISGMGVGPVTGMFLAELGAEVIKVEPPHGDLALTVAPKQRGTSVLYISANLGKRGLVLDLKDPNDLERAHRVAEQCDVFIENFRVGVVDRLGLGYPALSERNPGLVYCSLSGFGPRGPLASLPSVDTYIQAFSGFASLNGSRGQAAESLRNIGFIDLSTAAMAVPAILAALVRREQTGRGQYVIASMLEAATVLQSTRVAEYLATGRCAPPQGSGMPYAVPDQAFQALDGYLAVSARTQHEWERLCRAVDREDLLDDPRYRTLAERVVHRETLIPDLEKTFRRYPCRWWTTQLVRAGVPCGRFLAYDEMCQHPQVRANRLMTELETPHWGTIRVAGLPWTFSSTPGGQRPGPRPGSDTDEVLAELLGKRGDATR